MKAAVARNVHIFLGFFKTDPMICIFIFALAVRMLGLFYVSDLNDTDMHQFDEFGAIVNHLLSGEGFSRTYHGKLFPSAYMPPAYAFFITGIFLLFGKNTFSFILIHIVEVVLGAAMCIILYKIGEKYFSAKVALGAGLIASIYPVFVYMCTQFSVSPYIFLNCLLFLLLTKLCEEPSNFLLVITGLILGLLTLFRAEVLGYIPFLIGWIFFNVRKDSRIKATLIPILLIFLILTPWSLRNYLVFNKLIPVTTVGGYALWRGHNPQASGGADSGHIPPCIVEEINNLLPTKDFEVKRDNIFLRKAISFIKTNPGENILLTFKKFIFFWTIDPTYGPDIASLSGRKGGSKHPLYIIPWLTILPFFIIGLVSTRYQPKKYSLFYLYFTLSTVVAMVFFVLPRYRLFIEPFIIIFATHGVMICYDRFFRR